MTNTSYAVFGVALVKLGTLFEALPAFTLTAGLRYNWDEREIDVRNRATFRDCNFTVDDDGDPTTPEMAPSPENYCLALVADFSDLNSISRWQHFDRS